MLSASGGKTGNGTDRKRHKNPPFQPLAGDDWSLGTFGLVLAARERRHRGIFSFQLVIENFIEQGDGLG